MVWLTPARNHPREVPRNVPRNVLRNPASLHAEVPIPKRGSAVRLWEANCMSSAYSLLREGGSASISFGCKERGRSCAVDTATLRLLMPGGKNGN